MLEIGTRFVSSCQNRYPIPEKAATSMSILASFHHTAPMVWLLAYDGEKLAGMAHVTSALFPWANVTQAFIHTIYVEPTYRGGVAFARLLDAVLSWCIDKKCAQVSWIAATGDIENDAKLIAALKKRGWSQSGVDMVKPLQ